MLMGKNPNYMGSWDLEELPNKEITLTIKEIKDEEVVTNGKTETCTACYWVEKNYKPMILNVCNKKRICKLYKTKDTEKLKGIDQVKAFGDIFDALRIRPRKPQVNINAAKPKCEQCGNDINAIGNMTPEQAAQYTKVKYGKKLCSECATALAQGVK